MISLSFHRALPVDRAQLVLDVKAINQSADVVRVFDKYDEMEKSHKINKAIGYSLVTMGAGAIAALVSPAMDIHDHCLSLNATMRGCGTAGGSTLGAIAGVLSIVGGIRSLVLGRSHLTHHVATADKQLAFRFGNRVNQSGNRAGGGDTVARYRKLSIKDRLQVKQQLVDPPRPADPVHHDLQTATLLEPMVHIPTSAADGGETV